MTDLQTYVMTKCKTILENKDSSDASKLKALDILYALTTLEERERLNS